MADGDMGKYDLESQIAIAALGIFAAMLSRCSSSRLKREKFFEEDI